jgi:hypothetical protein
VAADKRGSKTVRDLALSLVVLGVVVAVIYVFIPHDSKATPVKTLKVDYTASLQQARRYAPYPVAAPEGLGSGWTATSDTFDGTDPHKTTWHLGLVSADQEYVGVEQSNGDPAAFVKEVTLGAHRDGARTVSAGGVVWEHWTGERYKALVRKQPGVTTVVLGTGTDAQIAKVAPALPAEHAGR